MVQKDQDFELNIPHTSVGIIGELFPRLHGAEISDEDPEAALPAIADRLAKKFTLPSTRVLACLQRLVSYERRGRPTTKASLFRSLLSGLPSLLSRALARMPAQEAVEFCETEDLDAFSRRERITRILRSVFTPLLSLSELGQLLSEFVEHQESNRRDLLATGLPATHFGLNRWLDLHCNKLYYTKLPIHLHQRGRLAAKQANQVGQRGILSASTDRVPAFPSFCVDWRRVATRSTELDPDLHEDFGTDLRPKERKPVSQFAWARKTRTGWTECGYGDASTLTGLASADVERLASLRPTVFEARRRVLCELAAALRGGDHDHLWERCLTIVTDSLTAEDVDFLLRNDVFFAGYEVRSSDAEMKLLPLLSGGVTCLFELIGHVQKELAIGTMAKTREALGDAIVLDRLRRPCLITDLKRSNWPQLTKLNSADPYLDLVAVGKGKQIREAADICAELDAQEPAFWTSFRIRAEDTLRSEFRALVGVRVKERFRPILEPLLQQWADKWVCGQSEEGGQQESDPSAYVLASQLWRRVFETYKLFKTFLNHHPEIRTEQRSKQRLWIHAGDFHRAVAARDKQSFDALDAAPEQVEAFVTEAAKRRSAVPKEGRRRRSSKKLDFGK